MINVTVLSIVAMQGMSSCPANDPTVPVQKQSVFKLASSTGIGNVYGMQLGPVSKALYCVLGHTNFSSGVVKQNPNGTIAWTKVSLILQLLTLSELA